MIHPKTTLKFINSEIGHGVVATEFIPKGTITWVQDKLDQIFDYRDSIVKKIRIETSSTPIVSETEPATWYFAGTMRASLTIVSTAIASLRLMILKLPFAIFFPVSNSPMITVT